MVGKPSMFLQSSVSSLSSVFVYNYVIFPKVWLYPPGGVKRKPANDTVVCRVGHSSLLVVGRGWPPPFEGLIQEEFRGGVESGLDHTYNLPLVHTTCLNVEC